MVREGGDTYVIIADVFMLMYGKNHHKIVNYPPIKIKFKNL